MRIRTPSSPWDPGWTLSIKRLRMMTYQSDEERPSLLRMRSLATSTTKSSLINILLTYESALFPRLREWCLWLIWQAGRQEQQQLFVSAIAHMKLMRITWTFSTSSWAQRIDASFRSSGRSSWTRSGSSTWPSGRCCCSRSWQKSNRLLRTPFRDLESTRFIINPVLLLNDF